MSGTTGLQPIPLYTIYESNELKYATASVGANPQSSALLAYFQKVAPSITSPAALLGNYKALSVVLGAFGLQGSINDTAILKKLLTQDPTSKNSLAQQLGNPKYQLFAQALSNWSPPPFATASGVAQIVKSYTLNTFEQTADSQAPGLANALYFTREASQLKSVTQVQADSNLLDVVVTGLGLPLQNFQDLGFDQQTSILTSKLKLSDLQNPAYVKRTAEQYLVAQQLNGSGSTAPDPGTIAALFSDDTQSDGNSLLTILDPGAAASGLDGSAGSTGANALSLFA